MENPPLPPPDFIFIGQVFDLIATATYTPPVIVCLDGNFAPGDRLFHYTAGAWTDITDLAQSTANRLCGPSNSLSPFAAARPLNHPPTADAGEYQPIEAASPAGATVTLAGSGSDPDGDPLTYTWSKGATTLGTGPTLAVPLPIGSHDITLTVDDGRGGTASAAAHIIVQDTTPPAIVISAPHDGAAYTLGEMASSSCACTDTASGVASCAGPAPSGDAIDTSTIGLRTFTVTADDRSGNSSTASSTYRVSYGVCLLCDPTKAKKSGSTVPIKLQICDASNRNYSSVAVTLHAVGVTLLATGDMGPPEDPGNANPDAAFRYDESLAGYVFNLKTTGYARGLYALTFTIGDDPALKKAEFRVQ